MVLERDNRKPATISISGTTTAKASVAKALGSYQSISSLNRDGNFVRGQFHAHPVVLRKWTSISIPSGSIADDIYQIHRCRINGDLAAYAASDFLPFNQSDSYSTWDNTLAAASVVRAHAKLQEADFDVGIILAELDETLSGLVKPLSELRKWINLFNKGRSKSPVKLSDTLNMLSGTWLEFRYGIMPTIRTIQDIISHVNELRLELDGKLLRKRGTVTWANTVTESDSIYPNIYRLYATGRWKISQRYTTSVFYKLDRPLSLPERYGYDIWSLPVLGWERVPLSFVVDWFWSIGDWLKTLTVNPAKVAVGSTTSCKSVVELEVSCTAAKLYDKVGSYIPGSSKFSMTSEKLERRLNQTLPGIPPVNPNLLSLKQKIDSLSLIWQRLPKPRR